MSTKNTPEVSIVLPPTDDQIGHIKGMSDKALRSLSRAQADAIIQGGVYNRAYDVMLRRVLAELTNSFVVIAERVDYDRTPEQIIRATRRVEYLNNDVMATIPRRRMHGIVRNVPVHFFCVRKDVTPAEVDAEYSRRELVADPYAQAAVNEAHEAFADEFPNATQWGLEGKVASYLAFRRWYGDRRHVFCRRSDGVWDGYWWLCGVPKVSALKAQ